MTTDRPTAESWMPVDHRRAAPLRGHPFDPRVVERFCAAISQATSEGLLILQP